jgi:ABC-type sugar transport system ATPase subunit
MLLALRRIEKRFGGVTALRNGNLQLSEGEIHLLMGENGAGKSTLMKIVAGIQPADGGEMIWRGTNVRFRNPAEASANGIAMVHQESLLAPHLTVAENIFLGREGAGRLGWVHRNRLLRDAQRLIEQHKFPLKADWTVERLSPAGKQLVEICRAIQHGSSLLIFDEPTSSLSESESAEVFRIVREMRKRGMGVIYITHRLEELRAIGDNVTVLRDGETVHTGPLADLSRERLIQHMVGREVSAIYHREPVAPGDVVLEVKHVTRAPLLKDISLSIRAGEVVGLAGLIGAGRTELCRAIFGIDPIEKGTISVGGNPIRLRNPRDAVAAGIALVPEDRQRAGLATSLPVGYNINLASLGAISKAGVLNHRAERDVSAEFIQKLRIKCHSPAQLTARLSGGNQQKVVISKWLARGARVFLFDEPTRGIDVGAKTEVFEVMDRLARNGAAILMVSSELPELIQVADRIVVMCEGSITAELPGRAAQEEIMRYAAPAHSAATKGNGQ